jgi:hypothetical protein
MAMMMLDAVAPIAPAVAMPAWPLPALRVLPARRPMRALALAPVSRLDGAIVLPTHPVASAMRRGLLTFLSDHEERVKVRIGGVVRHVRVGTRWHAPTPEAPAPVLAPAHGANLLKSHLDLVDQAYRRGGHDVSAAEPGDGQGFAYDLGDALSRLGYRRLAGGGFHPDTVKAHLARLQALAAHTVDVAGEAGAGAFTSTFWRFFAMDRVGNLRALEAPADWKGVKPSDRLLVLPGAWWEAIALPQYRLSAPRGLLALPLDGQGHQVNRIALQLAAELAVWERAEMRQGPHTMHRRVGALLDKAMVSDKHLLLEDAAKRLNTPKRLREYLAGDGFPDQGALAILRDVAGFGVDIHDEAAFWASGRGWVERFWEAKLAIEVRALDDRRLASFPTPTGDLPDAHWRVGAV